MSQFQFEPTEDGSPTARILTEGADGPSEAMHSLRGAFSETVYIYGAALEKASQERFSPRVLSMGLGLGYVELLATAIALRDSKAVEGESFEIVPELRDYFRAWLTEAGACPEDFKATYEEICRRTSHEIFKDDGARSSEIRQALAGAVTGGQWRLREELTGVTEFEKQFGTICFDAFSSKSTPDLWTEDFLRAFLQKTAASAAVLSTYACTGALKRALKSEGFEIHIRQGFSSKRDSTFAFRISN
jgi:S-adenosyl-L-methionine-dependent methyltransferase